MESDYQDSQATMDQRTSSSPNEEIIQMLTAISTRMVSGQQDLQNQLIRNDLKLEAELQRVRDDNEKFRQELRQEFITSIGAVTSPINNSVLPTSSPPSSSVNITSPSPNFVSQSADFQTQMLAILNDTFSKLSSVISDTSNVLHDTKQALSDSKSSDAKLEWIKFSGDQKKFRSWYLAIMAQISIAPWKELYDQDTNSVVSSTSNASLNGKLYAKIISSLDGPALQHMISRSHLCANGISLLQELHQMYRPKNVPEVIVAKTAEFWGNTKRFPHETVDDYYNRFHELLDDLKDADLNYFHEECHSTFSFHSGH